MSGKNFFKIVVVWVIALACLSVNGCKKREHPAEHPKTEEKKAGLTKDQLADAIEAYINGQAAANEGYFPIMDEKTGQQLQMTLVKVHRERLAKVGEDQYFACVDFQTPEGKLYDVDFFMKGPDKDNLTFSEFMIHKENGKERYTWYEEDGIWKTKPVEVEAVEPPAEQPKEEPNEPNEPNMPANPNNPDDPNEPNEPNKPPEHPREHPE